MFNAATKGTQMNRTKIIGWANTADRGQIVRKPVIVTFNDSGNVTVSGPCGMRDYCSEGFALRFAKRVLSHPSCAAEWV